MVLGILLTATLSFYAVLTLSAISITAFIIYSAIKRRIDLGFLLMLAAFAVASCTYTLSTSEYTHKTLNYTNKYVTLRGVTISAAKESSYSENYTYIFRVKSITNRHGTVDTSENIVLTSPKRLACKTGVTVKGIIKDFPKKMNENGFDTAMYYKSMNIFTRMYSEDISPSESTRVFSVYTLGGKVSESIDSLIYKYYKGDGAAILSAVIAGNKYHFSNEYNRVILDTSFKRVFHPAYLHIWIIMSLAGILRGVIRHRYRDIATVIIFISYALLQCTNIGFARCMICCALTIYYKLRYGSSFFPDTMATVVIFCVIVTPTILFNAAFLLSVAGGLIVWAFVPYLKDHMRFIPARQRHTVAAMTACAVFLTPVSAYYFNGFCIYSIFTPFITAPIVLSTLCLAPLVLVSLNLFGTAPIIGAYLNLMIRILYNLPYLAEKLPFSRINIGRPSLCTMMIIFCIIFIAYYFTKKRKQQIVLFSLALCGLCLASVVTAVTRIGSAEFMFVNVGQGDGSVIHTYFKETVIIDGGGGNSWSNYNPGQMQFVPYLEAKGYNHIEAAIVTHYHQDHAEGVANTLNRIKTDALFLPEIRDSDSEAMRYWASELKAAADKNGTEIYYVTENTRIEFDDGLVIDIFVPTEAVRNSDENNTTMPIKVQYGEFSALYTGDMGKKSELEFINQTDTDADILKVAHHGSRDSSSEEFISTVSPDYSIISCGEDNVYSHPHTETLERLSDTTVLRTDESGDIRIRARKSGKYNIEN